MPTSPLRDSTATIGRVLRQLDILEERARRVDESSEELFDEWQRGWNAGRSRIADRLRIIDEKLQRLAHEPPTTFRLGIVGVPEDGPSMRPMAG